MDRLRTLLREEAPAFPLWAPVFVGTGIQIYFWLPVEPPLVVFAVLIAGGALFASFFRERVSRNPLAALAAGLVVIGLCLGGARARIVEAPVLPAATDATVEGVIRDVTRTTAGRPRLVLDQLVIFGLAPDQTPARAQVSLLRDVHVDGLAPGMRVSIFARLGPPGGPVEPGGFDFRRDAWFKSLGAVGYARGAPAVIPAEEAEGLLRRLRLALAGARAEIASGLRAALPGETGAFAAAVTVGDRAGVSREATQALRDSNLAHLLAISGLHVGLVTALVFGAARLALAAVPYTARRWRTKSVAAVVALVAATGYLLLSGAAVATQRAYVMALVALVAVLLNRPAVTLRALAVAATAILVLTPEALAHVGFQMSFAATAAIIAGFDYARARDWNARLSGGGWNRRVGGYVLALTGTSLLAGLATAPFAAFHFHRVSNYGLIANLLAVPAMGFWVAPAALVAAALAPFGLEGWALAAMGRGIDAIMATARFVASLDGATRGVAAAPGIVLTLITLGGLGLCLGRAALRPLGAALAALGFVIWLVADTRPAALVAPEARLLGVIGAEGRALDLDRAQGYAARLWLEADGDAASQREAATRPGVSEQAGRRVGLLENGWRIVVAAEARPLEPAEAEGFCTDRTLILSAAPLAPRPSGGCRMISGDDLSRLGALAIDPSGDGLRIVSVRDRAGARFWSGRGGESDEDE